jgi:cytochrome bd-type quinol oxidase subunit 1
MTIRKEDKKDINIKLNLEPAAGKPGASMIGLLVVQIIIGYEWLLSGIAKIAPGNFPSALGDELAKTATGAADWYVGFLNSAIIPNAAAFGYIIEIAEVLAGIALIVGPLIWIFAWDRTPYSLRKTMIILMIAASVGGIFMALNFHVANGGNHPWLIPDSPFDEAVDVDLLMVAIQAVITAVQIIILSRLRIEITDVVPAATQVRHPKHA